MANEIDLRGYTNPEEVLEDISDAMPGPSNRWGIENYDELVDLCTILLRWIEKGVTPNWDTHPMAAGFFAGWFCGTGSGEGFTDGRGGVDVEP